MTTVTHWKLLLPTHNTCIISEKEKKEDILWTFIIVIQKSLQFVSFREGYSGHWISRFIFITYWRYLSVNAFDWFKKKKTPLFVSQSVNSSECKHVLLCFPFRGFYCLAKLFRHTATPPSSAPIAVAANDCLECPNSPSIYYLVLFGPLLYAEYPGITVIYPQTV